mmetsp:Transcript_7421/g.10419  ORF Transcript_7421/g.10419 Transcript_7421/m.10419 type:complete len:126 (+) Transcript_7421:123-500(+)
MKCSGDAQRIVGMRWLGIHQQRSMQKSKARGCVRLRAVPARHHLHSSSAPPSRFSMLDNEPPALSLEGGSVIRLSPCGSSRDGCVEAKPIAAPKPMMKAISTLGFIIARIKRPIPPNTKTCVEKW